VVHPNKLEILLSSRPLYRWSVQAYGPHDTAFSINGPSSLFFFSYVDALEIEIFVTPLKCPLLLETEDAGHARIFVATTPPSPESMNCGAPLSKEVKEKINQKQHPKPQPKTKTPPTKNPQTPHTPPTQNTTTPKTIPRPTKPMGSFCTHQVSYGLVFPYQVASSLYFDRSSFPVLDLPPYSFLNFPFLLVPFKLQDRATLRHFAGRIAIPPQIPFLLLPPALLSESSGEFSFVSSLPSLPTPLRLPATHSCVHIYAIGRLLSSGEPCVLALRFFKAFVTL